MQLCMLWYICTCQHAHNMQKCMHHHYLPWLNTNMWACKPPPPTPHHYDLYKVWTTTGMRLCLLYQSVKLCIIVLTTFTNFLRPPPPSYMLLLLASWAQVCHVELLLLPSCLDSLHCYRWWKYTMWPVCYVPPPPSPPLLWMDNWSLCPFNERCIDEGDSNVGVDREPLNV